MNRIKDARKKAGIKQTDLCSRLKISQSALSGYENGKYEPDCATWVSLSEILNVSIDYLMGLDAPVSAAPVSASTDTDTELLRKYHALDARGQQLIQTMLEHEYEQAQKEEASITSPA